MVARLYPESWVKPMPHMGSGTVSTIIVQFRHNLPRIRALELIMKMIYKGMRIRIGVAMFVCLPQVGPLGLDEKVDLWQRRRFWLSLAPGRKQSKCALW